MATGNEKILTAGREMEKRKPIDDYVGGNSDNWRKVWTIYTFLVWYEEYFVKR